MQKNWWKESVIYQIYPRSFKDSNGDGVGDLQGIIEKLDYLKELGVDIIWLGPCFKSPNDDNGYDISDYYDIMDEFGTMSDFDELLKGLHDRDMRLLMDLVVNHTSDEHEWFVQSKSSRDNPYRDYYYWREGEDGQPPNNWVSFFSGSAWEYDENATEYYLHLFSKKQPDLNWENPKVREEIYKIIRFWLEKGVDGFRMDVIPLISKRLDFEDADISNFNRLVEKVYSNGPRVHEFIQEMYQAVLKNYDIMTVGEGPGISADLGNLYVGKDRGELNMIFHLDHMFMDHGPGGRFDPRPQTLSAFKKIFNDWDAAIGDEGWINIFLDNHDFPRMVSRFGDDKSYRVESAKLLATLVCTLRGTPCIYQGSEIGMTNVAFESVDDYRDVEMRNFYEDYKKDGGKEEDFLPLVHAQGRDNARTPFQWDDSPQAGFSSATPWINVNPNYKQINASKALADEDSIFYFYKMLLQFRKEHPTIVYGQYEDLDPSHENIFVYRRFDETQCFYFVLNFSSYNNQYRPPFSVEGKEVAFSNRAEVSLLKDEGVLLLQPWEVVVLH